MPAQPQQIVRAVRLGVVFRHAQVERAALNEADRTVRLSFSSDQPVDQWFGREILDHSSEAVMLDRLNSGAPLLCDHDRGCQVGVIEKAWVEKGRGLATVRFGRSPRAEQEFQDVKDGIRTKVSVGYRVHKMILEEQEGGEETYRCTLWEPLEISTVSIPADDTIGIGRSQAPTTPPTELTMNRLNRILLDSAPAAGGGSTAAPPAPAAHPSPAPTPGLDVRAVADQTRSTELTRIREISEIGRRFDVPQADTDRFLNEGLTTDAFRAHVLESRGKAKPIALADPSIGMSRGEVKRYSLLRALNSLAHGRQLDGLEAEASRAVAKQLQREPKGFFIPHDIASRSLTDSAQLTRADIEAIIGRLDMQRALNATTATAGGFLVGTELLGSSLIELLRNKVAVVGLGARMLTGLVGDIAIPRHTGGATAYWLTESGTVTSSQQTFGQLGLTPHRLAASTPYTKQLLAQASLDVEALVRNDLMAVLALAKDLAAINGSGASGEPLGIMNTTGLGSVTFGAAPTWAKVVEFETTLATANADVGNIAFLTTPAVRGKWKTVEKATGTAQFLWPDGGLVNGYRALASNQVPSNKVILGNWSDLILADWDGMDVVVDPYTLAKAGQVEITITIMCDLGVRHAASFVVSTDSGAQ